MSLHHHHQILILPIKDKIKTDDKPSHPSQVGSNGVEGKAMNYK